MIEIYVDYKNMKIVGYNTIIHNTSNSDSIFVEGDEEKKVLSSGINNNLFYIDGKVTELKDDEIPQESEASISLHNVMSEINEISKQASGENEYKTFMDNIINGMSMEEAKNIAKNNREKLATLEKQRDELTAELKKEEVAGKLRLFESEEAKIDYKYFLSVIAIIRDENDYLEEWIRYHIEEMGVDHFYLYDNESEIPAQEYLESVNFKYLDHCTIKRFPTTRFSQQDAHTDFLNNYKNETKWFIGMDPDEYIKLKDDSKSLIDFLKENTQYAKIKCQWKHYTANGQETQTAEPDMIRFPKETTWYDEKHGGKTFAQTNRIRGFTSYTPLVRLDAETADYDDHPEITTEFMQLNHYYTRSYEEWLRKIKRGSCHPTFLRKYSEFFEINPDMKYLDTGKELVQEYCPKREWEESEENKNNGGVPSEDFVDDM